MSLKIAAFFATCLLMTSYASSQEPKLLPLTKVGIRTIEDGNETFSFPWYHVKADHNQIVKDKIWQRITAAAGSKTAYIGDYGTIELIEFSKDGGHSSMYTSGMRLFFTRENARFKVAPGKEVGPGEEVAQSKEVGPGKVYIRHWYFDDSKTKGPMRFKSLEHDYVVCLDREPISTFKSYGGKPGCDLDTELSHVIGMIEVEHTYNWKDLPDWKVAPINDQSLIRLRVLRRRYDLPDIRFEKGESNKHEVANRDGVSVASDDVFSRLLYALRSCQWRELNTPHKFSRWPTVTETQIVIATKTGQKTLKIFYDNGAWILNIGDKQYKTAHPLQLFEVQSMVDQLVEKAATATP